MKNVKTQSGFTLVELAIVLVIVGLLISGVLKGQELIANAQLNSTVAKIKAIESAGVTFRDNYSYLPGDLPNGQTRLQNCNAGNVCATGAPSATIGDGRIGADNAYGLAINAVPAAVRENEAAWAQLAAANLVGEVAVNPTTNEVGVAVPSAAVGGGFRIGFEQQGVMTGVIATGNAVAGHYLNLTNNTNAALAATATVISPSLMERLDRKMDDAKPNTGSVLAVGTIVAVTGCASDATQAATYRIADEGQNCGAVIRIFN